MNRITAVFAAAFSFAIYTQASADLSPPPNIVVFLSDDHGYLDTSIAGAREFRTPNLEQLAKGGITCTHVFATSPSCAPSRASILTGMMPMRSGSMLNHQSPRAGVKKLPAYLHEIGYEVVAFGKVAHYKQGKDYGFDLVSHDDFHNDDCVNAAVKFLDSWKGGKPLCLLVGTNWPHVPWPEVGADSESTSDNVNAGGAAFNPPPTHVDTPETRVWRARYAAAVERFDHDLGLVYHAAKTRLGPNLLFIHCSDHGAQWPFGKWNLYDSGTRVPFVATWPGVIKPGTHSDAMISLADVLPTIVEAAGGNPPTAIDGRSFMDVLSGHTSRHRDCIFTTHSGDGRINAYPMRAVRTRDWKYIRNLDPAGEHTTHIDRGKKVDGNTYWRSWLKRTKTDSTAAAIVDRYHHRPVEELYDLRNDPHEQHNLAHDEQHADVLRDLRAEVDGWLRAQGDAGQATEGALQAEVQP
jgi:uncharacterized sulfatase